MASNVVIPASGTGTTSPTVATDQLPGAASAHAQYMKLLGGVTGDVSGIGGQPGAGIDTGLYGLNVVPIQRFNLRVTASAVSASGDTLVITSPGAGKINKIYGYSIQCVGAGPVTAQLLKGTAGSFLSQAWQFSAREGVVRQGLNPPNFFASCGANTGLVLNLNSAVMVNYEFQYWNDDAT